MGFVLISCERKSHVDMAGLEVTSSGYSWSAGPPLFKAGPEGAPDEVSVKDPSVVFFNGVWHVFYTCRSKKAYSLGYVSSNSLDNLNAAPRHYLSRLKAGNTDYVAAPQVFYFSARKEWYLIYQVMLKERPGTRHRYTPMYSVSRDIMDPSSWSEPRELVHKFEKNKWIDFWVICDEDEAYLFYTRNQSQMYYMTTSIEDFPHGFNNPQLCDGVGLVHEAVNVYRVRDSDEYLMLVEMNIGGVRYFDYALSDDLSGPWTRMDKPFSSGESLSFKQGAAPWTTMVSHGELIRAGYDERFEIESIEKIDFLVQGTMEAALVYENTRWSLGLISNY
jgi:hypothetical protein